MTAKTPKRSLKSMKLTAHLHWQFMGLGLLLCLAFACAVTMTVVILFQMQSDLSHQLSRELAEKLRSEQQTMQYLFAAQIVLFLGGIAASLVLAAHRIAGPHIAMKRTCNAIRAGKTDTRLTFRSYDNLGDVEECFNAMIDGLVSGKEAPAPLPPATGSASLSKSGLTLVEVMIVVFIIGLVATIAIPAFIRPRERARQTICIGNLRMLETAKESWALQEGKNSGDTPTPDDLEPYIKGGAPRMRCPAGGGIPTFEGHYSIESVGTDPQCLIVPATHLL